MGLLSYLRGEDLLGDRSTRTPSEARSLPPAENQLPLMAGYTLSSVMPTQALAITAGGAAVRLTRVPPVSGGDGPVASAAGPCFGVGMADQAQETPESRLYTAGFTRQLEFWVTPDGERVLDLNDALAALDAGKVKPAGLALPDQPGFRELTAEAVDALADRLFRPPPLPPPDWLEPLAELVVEKLKPVVRAEVRSALRAEARGQARERST